MRSRIWRSPSVPAHHVVDERPHGLGAGAASPGQDQDHDRARRLVAADEAVKGRLERWAGAGSVDDHDVHVRGGEGRRALFGEDHVALAGEESRAPQSRGTPEKRDPARGAAGHPLRNRVVEAAAGPGLAW